MARLARGEGKALQVATARDGENYQFILHDTEPEGCSTPPAPGVDTRFGTKSKPGFGVAHVVAQQLLFELVHGFHEKVCR